MGGAASVKSEEEIRQMDAEQLANYAEDNKMNKFVSDTIRKKDVDGDLVYQLEDGDLLELADNKKIQKKRLTAAFEQLPRGGTTRGKPSKNTNTATNVVKYGKKISLHLGIGKGYTNWNKLPNAENDAVALKERFELLDFDAKVVTGSSLTRQTIETEINYLGEKCSENDLVIVTWSGHGATVTLANGKEQGYLIPSNAPKPNNDGQMDLIHLPELVSMKNVAAWMDERIRAIHACLFLDCCFSGFATRRGTSNSRKLSMAKQLKMKCRYAINAGTKDETVDDGSGAHSPFVTAMLQSKVFTGDETCDIEKLYIEIKDLISEMPNVSQTPTSGRLEGDEGGCAFIGLNKLSIDEAERVNNATKIETEKRGAITTTNNNDKKTIQRSSTQDLRDEIEKLKAEEEAEKRRVEMENEMKELLARKEQREKEKKKQEAEAVAAKIKKEAEEAELREKQKREAERKERERKEKEEKKRKEEEALKELYKTLNEKYKKEFPGRTPLVCACEKGRVEDVKGMIRDARAAGMDVTAMVSEVGTDSDGNRFTPLIAAACNEHSTIIEILLQYNADTATTTDGWGRNALHYAACYNKRTTTTVQLLLDNMKLEDINHKNTSGRTPLNVCYNENYSSIKQQLIDLIRQKGGKRESELEEDGKKPLNDYESLNEKYKNEFPEGTPLVCACEKGRVEDVEGMIRGARLAGMDVTAMVSEVGRTSSGTRWTPLMAAARYEHSTIIEILLQYNADTATTDNNGCNALHYAAWTNKTTTTIVQLLLNNMKLEDINHKTTTGGFTPLDRCYEFNDSSIKQQLIDLIRQKGGKRASELEEDGKKPSNDYESLNEKYKKEFPKGTPLVCACEYGRVEDVEGMIRGARAAGMDVTAMVSEVGKDSNGYSRTPLMAAAQYEHSTIIEILLQYNADTATTDEYGYNALHWAAWKNETTTTIVQLLLNNMKLEDINHKNGGGLTPLDLCYENNYSSIKQQLIDLIRQKGGKRRSEL